jgi:hypothetical protein
MNIDYRDLDLVVDIKEWLEAQGFKFRENSEELIANSCINCGKAKKMYISKESGLFECKSCGFKGNAITLVMKVGSVNFTKALEICYGIKKEKIDVTKLDEEDWEDAFKVVDKKKSSFKEEPSEPIELPRYFQKLTKANSSAWEYLIKRGLPDDVIESLNLYYWAEAKRVVFTIETDGQVMGYMARDITGSHETKTLNSRGSFRRSNFWNFDRIKNNSEVIVCEGIFSAIKCGPERSIALLGKVFTKGQINLLRTTKVKKVILCLDVGTDKEQQTIYEQLSVYYPGQVLSIEFPPLVAMKQNLDAKILNEINIKYKTSLKINDSIGVERLHAPNILYMTNSDKEKIKEVLESNKLILVSPSALELMKILKKADHIDAGDYSFEEMNAFISSAKVYRKS